jgi:hypothetical protein
LAATMTENQRFVASIWSIVSSTYYDPSFNGLEDHGWHDAETCALEANDDYVEQRLRRTTRCVVSCCRVRLRTTKTSNDDDDVEQ